MINQHHSKLIFQNNLIIQSSNKSCNTQFDSQSLYDAVHHITTTRSCSSIEYLIKNPYSMSTYVGQSFVLILTYLYNVAWKIVQVCYSKWYHFNLYYLISIVDLKIFILSKIIESVALPPWSLVL